MSVNENKKIIVTKLTAYHYMNTSESSETHALALNKDIAFCIADFCEPSNVFFRLKMPSPLAMWEITKELVNKSLQGAKIIFVEKHFGCVEDHEQAKNEINKYINNLIIE